MEIIAHNKYYQIVIDKIRSNPDGYIQLLNDEIVEKVKFVFRHQQRQCEYLSTLYLIYKITNTLQLYTYDTHGKPICEITRHNLSITHTDKYIGLMISDKGYVGIDMEQTDRNLQRISTKFINSIEQQWVKSNLDLIKIWTAKEALYKMIQNASPDFKNDYIVFNNYTAIVTKPKQKKLTLSSYHKNDYYITWVFEEKTDE
ncbi:MAG: 4'-phosphopantetheinyl transferase superfamily protein [Bacteroidales bacterium]|nr:4'-phosphopantetheinyl transferase superfamily protein [Bacteroidales bacterium]